MAEMVLALPFVLVILVLLIFFGRGVVRVQHAMVMDRYEAWRRATGAPGPQFHEGTDNGEQLNATFFGGKAAGVRSESDNYFPRDANNLLIDAAAQYPSLAGEIAYAHIYSADRGRAGRFATSHREPNRLMDYIDRPIESDHVRIGNEWAWVNGWRVNDAGGWERRGSGPPDILAASRIHFADFDQAFAELGQSNAAARRLRDFYDFVPPYIGPDVE